MKRTSGKRGKRAVRTGAVAPAAAGGGTPPASPRKGYGRAPAAVIFALLYAVTFPWYLPRDWIDPTVWAFPAWGVVTVAGSVAIGAFTAWIYLFAWPQEASQEASLNAPPDPDSDP